MYLVFEKGGGKQMGSQEPAKLLLGPSSSQSCISWIIKWYLSVQTRIPHFQSLVFQVPPTFSIKMWREELLVCFVTKIPKDQGLRDVEHPFQLVFPLQTTESCSCCHTDVRCVPSGGKSWGTLWLQPLAVTVSWNAAPFAQNRQWKGVSLFA